MSISLQEMQRQLHAYAMDEMRNRGLEDAAKYLQARAVKAAGAERYEMERNVAAIRGLKTDPARHLSDWWAEQTPLPQSAS